jgi:hypothetical protein
MKSSNVTAESLEITRPENHDKTIDRPRHDCRQLMVTCIEHITRCVVAMKRDELDVHCFATFSPLGFFSEQSVSDFAERTVGPADSRPNPIPNFAGERSVSVIDADK